MNKKIYITLVVIIFIIAIIIRFWNFPYQIGDINCDEAMSAINAKSIAENGTDMYGTTYPVYFEGWLIGGQSAFAIYITAFFIKIFGFSTITVRLPILLVSLSSLIFMLLLINRIFKDKRVGLIVLLLLAINPWDILQSQWLLDCNFFPHIMLIAIYLLHIGIEDKKDIALYSSMVIFAITLYTYGIALYLVPIFLLVTVAYLLVARKISITKLLLCLLIFLVIALPIILMTVIQLFNLPTIHIGKVTIQNFEYATRKNDMLLFSENKITMLINNINYLTDILLYQSDELVWNAFPSFGTIYLVSLPIVIWGIISICYQFFSNKTEERYNRFGIVLILFWLLIGIIGGLLINDINVNRINIIWYVLLILNGIGIYEIIRVLSHKKILIVLFFVIYLMNFIGFIYYFHTRGTKEIENSYTWSRGLVGAIEYANRIEKWDEIILSTNSSNSDKKDVFIRYGTQGRQEEIKKKEFLKYYQKNQVLSRNFSTNEKNYDIEEIKEDEILTEKIYIMTLKEYDHIQNKDEYQVNYFNNYVVLVKK